MVDGPRLSARAWSSIVKKAIQRLPACRGCVRNMYFIAALERDVYL
jgi:hypothetical protein